MSSFPVTPVDMDCILSYVEMITCKIATYLILKSKTDTGYYIREGLKYESAC